MGFIIRGVIWDIPILIFAYVLFWGPREFPDKPIQVLSFGLLSGLPFHF